MGNRQQAVVFYNQALAAVNNKDDPKHLEHAIHLFASACITDPTWGQAFYHAGNNHSDLNAIPSALACWRRALECGDLDEGTRARCMINMGWRLHGLGRSKEALEITEKGLAIDPNLQYGWVHKSQIYTIFGKADLSLQAAERAYDLMPSDPIVEIAYAFALLHARKLALGFKHFEARFAYKLKSYLNFPYPKWEGERDRTIYLDSDQGLGDTISFSRFIPLAAKRSRYLHLMVQPELVRLFMHAFVGLANVNIVPKPAPFVEADAWSTFVGLPTALGLTDEEIRSTPPIDCPRGSLPGGWKVPDRKLHIGIAWSGSSLNDINPHRSIPFEQFLELYRVPGVQLYSLQVDGEFQRMYDAHGLPLVRDLKPLIRDIVDTTTILRELDLVICCESALGHICVMVGKECWIPYSYLGLDYRVGMRGADQLWSNHRIFKQGEDRQWQPVFFDICFALEARVRHGLDKKAGAARAGVGSPRTVIPSGFIRSAGS
jgi:tetratricopeptide (TPR) repeat protein